MPFQTAAKPRHKGWWFDQINNRLVAVFNGTEVFDFDANDVAFASGVSVSLAGAGTGTADITLSGAGSDFISLLGSVRIGTPAVFATTQGQGVVHMGGSSLGGVAPSGATVTSGAVFASDTVVRKIIADGTASNVET